MKVHVFFIIWLLISSMVLESMVQTNVLYQENIELSDVDNIDDKEAKDEIEIFKIKILQQILSFSSHIKNNYLSSTLYCNLVLKTQNIKASDNQPPELI